MRRGYREVRGGRRYQGGFGEVSKWVWEVSRGVWEGIKGVCRGSKEGTGRYLVGHREVSKGVQKGIKGYGLVSRGVRGRIK